MTKEEYKQEIVRCVNDFEYFYEKYVVIKNKDGKSLQKPKLTQSKVTFGNLLIQLRMAEYEMRRKYLEKNYKQFLVLYGKGRK